MYSSTLEKIKQETESLTVEEKSYLADYLWSTLPESPEIDESLYKELDEIVNI